MIQRKKAVFFDAGGTLFAPYPSVGELYVSVAAKYGMEAEAAAVESAFHKEFARRDGMASLTSPASVKDEKEWWKSLVREAFLKVTVLRRFDEYFDELYDLFGRPDPWRLYPEVPEVLKELNTRGFILGIVSNWDSRLHDLCGGIGVDRYFDFILASAVVGSAKPHNGIFRQALSLAGTLPEEAVHVGDSVEDDWHGARGAGIDALVVNRNGRELPGIRAIDSLRGVFKYLEEGGTGAG